MQELGNKFGASLFMLMTKDKTDNDTTKNELSNFSEDNLVKSD